MNEDQLTAKRAEILAKLEKGQAIVQAQVKQVQQMQVQIMQLQGALRVLDELIGPTELVGPNGDLGPVVINRKRQ